MHEDNTYHLAILSLTALVGACALGDIHPSHGMGAADLTAADGFGLGASGEGSPVNQASPGPTVIESSGRGN